VEAICFDKFFIASKPAVIEVFHVNYFFSQTALSLCQQKQFITDRRKRRNETKTRKAFLRLFFVKSG